MEVYAEPSCSYEYEKFIERNNVKNTFCISCLAKNGSVIHIRRCNHKEFIMQWIGRLLVDIPELYLCASCHQMLKKIEAFGQQINMNYCKKINSLSLENNKHYKLIATPLTRTEVILVEFKAEVYLKNESQEQRPEIEVPIIKKEFNSTDFEITSNNDTVSTEPIDNLQPTINAQLDEKPPETKQIPKINLPKRHRQKEGPKRHRQKEGPKRAYRKLDNFKPDTLPIDKLDKEYDGKIEVINLSMEELQKYREEKRLEDSYINSDYKCEFCIKSFIFEYKFEDHKKQSHTQSPNMYKCKICESVFKSNGQRNRHCMKHYRRYVCCICKKMGTQLESIIEHYNETHPHSPPIEKAYLCSKCGFVSNSPRKYRSHMYSGKSGGSVCEKRTKTPSTLFKCNKCLKAYKLKSCLDKHMKSSKCSQVKTVEKAYCPTCDKFFKTEYNYKKHLIYSGAHVTEETFKLICDICDKKFKVKTALEEHMLREHLKMKNYKCEHCGLMMYTKRILRKHVNFVHLKIRPPRDKVCQYCSMAFNSNGALKTHIRCHTGERPLKCPFCEATFGHDAALYLHKRHVHKVPKRNVTQ